MANKFERQNAWTDPWWKRLLGIMLAIGWGLYYQNGLFAIITSKNFQSNELKVNQFELSCIHRVSLSSTFKSKDGKFPNTFNFQIKGQLRRIVFSQNMDWSLHCTTCNNMHFCFRGFNILCRQGSMTGHSQVLQPTCYWTGQCFVLNLILLFLFLLSL